VSAKVAHADGPPLEALEDLVWVGDIPTIGARRCPDRDAIVFADRHIHLSYSLLDDLSNGFACLMQACGLKPGERIAYLGKNSDLFYVALFGAIRAGLVLVAMNWRLAPPEIRFQLADSHARLLIFDPDLSAHIEAGVRDLDEPPMLIPTDGVGGLRTRLERSRKPPPLRNVNDQIILQLYTSGTTGTPKGVPISHLALSLARHAELISRDFAHVPTGCITLSAMPNFHIGGMSWVLMGLVRLGTVVITAEPTATNMLKLIRHYQVRHTWMVPTLIRAVVDALRLEQPRDVPAFDGMFYGAMPMDVNLLRECMALMKCSFLQFFGMTEVSGAATALGPRDHDPARPKLLKSVGTPYPGMSIEIRDPDHRLLQCGQHGEIWIKSPTMMHGYWQLPDRTAEALVDGWYATGDGGYLDDNGYLFLTDRIKDMIVTGGENVYPVEVEQVLNGHPAILEAVVVGLPDPRWGERVTAVVERRPGTHPTEIELIEFCRGKIADYKCPKQLEFADVLPRTASGKVQRGALRRSLMQRTIGPDLDP
jgi:acyl-CoA synthetase (AMP-forming)/AMP-acid ligase II